MNRLLKSVAALAAIGALAGCAQSSPMGQGMMMGQMPMMRGGGSAQMDRMMAGCMEHMQAMSPHSSQPASR